MVIFQRIFIILLLLLNGGHITLLGMDNPAPVTFACDWCQAQKETLNKYGPEKACKGIDCTHILCNSCDAALSKKYSALPEDQRFFYCHRCRAFYTERNKVCWFKDTSGWSGVESFADVTAQYFKEQYGQEAGARQLPLATADTVLPNSANKSTVPLVPNNPQPHPHNKGPISKLYPLGFIGLVAASAAIYYYWSSDQEEKNDEQDEEDTVQSDQINEGSKGVK